MSDDLPDAGVTRLDEMPPDPRGKGAHGASRYAVLLDGAPYQFTYETAERAQMAHSAIRNYLRKRGLRVRVYTLPPENGVHRVAAQVRSEDNNNNGSAA